MEGIYGSLNGKIEIEVERRAEEQTSGKEDDKRGRQKGEDGGTENDGGIKS